jgi:hypothetical protein
MEWGDWLAQLGNIESKETTVAAINRVRILPSAQDVSRMEQALIWPARYLRSLELMLRIVQRVALYRSRDLDSQIIARRLKRSPSSVRHINRAGLDRIASGLRHDDIAVF